MKRAFSSLLDFLLKIGLANRSKSYAVLNLSFLGGKSHIKNF